MAYRKISDNPEVQLAYARMRRRGVAHSMAEILAIRRVPSLRTNTTFLAGRKPYFGTEEKQMHTNCVCGVAKRHGLDPANYVPTLADYPGDPNAFLPNDDPYGHVKRLERARKERLAKASDREN